MKRILLIIATISAISTAIPLRSVLVFRHCLRSTPTSAYGAPGYDQFNNYSSHQFPSWPVPVYQCLPHGIDILQSAGKQIGPSLPSPVVFKVDTDAKRDNDTANALLEGMGMESGSYISSADLFHPVLSNVCPPLPKNEAIAALKARFAASTVPNDHLDRLRRLQRVLGKGVAPALEDIVDTVKDNGYFTGGASVASEFAEAFLMQYGGNLPTAWGEITTPEPIYDFLHTHTYYRQINDRVLPVVARSHTMMTNVITNFLKNGNGTLILVGHDSDLDALSEMFGMSWDTKPFPSNATTPGSALRFDISAAGNVVTSIHYQNFNGSSYVNTVPTTFTWLPNKNEFPTLALINEWLKPRLDAKCM